MNTEASSSKPAQPLGTVLVVIVVGAVLWGMWFLGQAVNAEAEATRSAVDSAVYQIEAQIGEVKDIAKQILAHEKKEETGWKKKEVAPAGEPPATKTAEAPSSEPKAEEKAG